MNSLDLLAGGLWHGFLSEKPWRSAAAVPRRTGRRHAVSLMAAGLMLGCSGPVPKPFGTSTAMADQPSPILLSAPSLSPDGTAILFAFKYGNLPYKLAVVSADPADTRVAVQLAPLSLHWTEAVWAPDGVGFAAVSRCEGDGCYEGAQGHHVWFFTGRPGPDNLRRLTPERAGVRRGRPFFGRSAGEVYWVFSSDKRYEGVPIGVNANFIARAEGGREAVLLPHDPEFLGNGAIRSAKAWFTGVRPAGSIGDGGLYFVGRPRSGTLPAVSAAVNGKLRYEPALFRWRGGEALELARDTPVLAVDAQHAGGGYATASSTPNFAGRPVDFDVVRDGVAERRLSFVQGDVLAMPVSESMDTIAFASFHAPREQVRFWVHRKGMAQAVDLDVAERVRREVARQIERERGR